MQKTNFPFEILVHDDCCNDGTKEIIEEYTSKYP
jgi:glycosyltransferase involved in cell wall biosynthesis